jgi:hypothetical protein
MDRAALARLELSLRSAVVFACALALILAGPSLPG